MRFFLLLSVPILSFLFILLISDELLSKNPASDCVCEEKTCDPCFKQISVEFYTLPCSEGNSVKSCKKPICEPMDTKECEEFKSQLSGRPDSLNSPAARTSVSTSTSTSTSISVAEDTSESVTKAPRVIKREVGAVIVSKGTTHVTHLEGSKEPGKMGTKIFEQDILETGEDGKLKVLFVDKNLLTLTPRSKTVIQTLRLQPTDPRTFLELLYGKIRNQVQNDYSSGGSFEVKTKTAIAGVRGTDFVISALSGKEYETRVDTLMGEVQLSNSLRKKSVVIPAGQSSSFLVQVPLDGVFTEEDIAQFASRGYFTPVYKLSEKELKKLEEETFFKQDDPKITVTSNQRIDVPICSKPDGFLNSCLWICINNPSGSKVCRTDLKQVQCVRKRCNANGQWAEETRLPAHQGRAFCEGSKDKNKAIVKPCNY